MKLGYVIAYVHDVPATLAFYERAFGLARRFATDDGSYGELDTGATTLAFASETLAGKNLPGGFRPLDRSAPPAAVEIALVTDDVAAALKVAVDAGATHLSGPTQKPWGQTIAYLRDESGLLVELCTPMG